MALFPPLRVQQGIKKATGVNQTKPLTGEKKATNQTPFEVQGDEKMVVFKKVSSAQVAYNKALFCNMNVKMDQVKQASRLRSARCRHSWRKLHSSCPKHSSRREKRTSRVAPNGRSKRRRVSINQTVINSDVYMNLEVSSGSMENILIEEVFKLLKCMREDNNGDGDEEDKMIAKTNTHRVSTIASVIYQRHCIPLVDNSSVANLGSRLCITKEIKQSLIWQWELKGGSSTDNQMSSSIEGSTRDQEGNSSESDKAIDWRKESNQPDTFGSSRR
ncbi:hypothetical protein RHGRI_028953 [Rhododendron griersonianum]|uniref:Uncharacterized protein n=1 Tax=Rhododendron griersonianum TaxID=479676 RepID=A0AAV6IJY5_9ERIC|nr:hypothetical protein RHGRI_028953 [Rhododendron griersonianum]KAG5528185.1 hypothetical protein RHGRI_028953 [Rhododendron griersonianum]